MEQAANIAGSTPAGPVAPAASMDHVDVRCPECGRLSSQMEHVLARLLRVSRVLARMTGVACLAALLAWQMFTPRISGMYLPTPNAQFALDGYSSERVAEIASGHSTEPPGKFSRSVLRVVDAPSERFLPGRTGVRVAFFDAPSQRSEYVGIGWPAKFLSVGRRGVFENALTRRGFQASKTDITLPRMGHWEVSGQLPRASPRDLWYFAANQLVVRPAPESTGGWDTQVYVDVGSLAVDATVFGAIVWLMAWAVRAWRSKRNESEEKRLWWTKARPLIATAVLLMVGTGVVLRYSSVTVLPPHRPVHQVNLSLGRVYFAADGLALLEFDTVELRRIAGTAAGDVGLAKEVLRATGSVQGTGGYLAIAPLPELEWDAHGTQGIEFGSAIPFLTLYRVSAFRQPEFTLPAVEPSASSHVARTWVR